MTICEDAVKLKGDNAALEETTFGLALFSELIDMDAMRAGRDDSAWPGGKFPSDQLPAVCFDTNNPLLPKWVKILAMPLVNAERKALLQ